MAVSGVADLAGRVLAARYRLLAPVGTGASGRVYVADDVRLHRRVAVKVLHAALADDPAFLRRFRAEAQVAASLHHPNVMAVYDWGEDELPFMVLELLEGGSLRGLLDAGKRLTAAQAAHVGRQVALALDYAHSRGLVHRDIKPANLLFDEHGIVRVADFGLARALAEASWTEPAGAMLGTARYAAPEQGTGHPLDGRADLYSLAIVLVESMTGRVPHQADTTLGTLAARAQRPIAAPPDCGALAPVLERAGMPEPADRYPDATTMATALEDAASQLPPPRPLALVGLGETAADPHPTTLRRPGAPAFYDQDADLAVTATRPRPTRPAPRSWLSTAVIAVVVAAVLGTIAFVVTRPREARATVPVPLLVGRSEEEAAAAASRAGLVVEVDSELFTDEAAGTVIDQSPDPGGWSGGRGTVSLVLSKGPEPVKVPDVTGKPGAEARDVLAKAGFALGETERTFDETVAKDAVIRTDPKAGAGAVPESTVVLVVSDGPKPVPVPDVAGKTYEEAAAALQGVRLGAEKVEEFSDTVEAGKVTRTEPAAGVAAPRDSVVKVFVSKGPELVAVPTLVGQTVEVASQALEALGLVADVENFRPGARVRAQAPTGGQVKKGSKVTLFL